MDAYRYVCRILPIPHLQPIQSMPRALPLQPALQLVPRWRHGWQNVCEWTAVVFYRLCYLVQAYEVLSDPDSRQSYNEALQSALIDAMDDYTGEAYSKWLVGHKMGKNWDTNETRAVFVVSPCLGSQLPGGGSKVSSLHPGSEMGVEASFCLL